MSTLLFDIETFPLSEGGLEAALSPASASVGVLGVLDLERESGTVYVTGEGVDACLDSKEWQLKYTSETLLLSTFWEGVQNYDVVVGFGTRRFDIPFLTHRSLAKGIRPDSRLIKNSRLTRQELPFQVDLFDEFSFQGVMSKPLSLRAFLSLNSVSTEAICADYEEVCRLYQADSFDVLARHMKEKLLGTLALYDVWRENLAPAHFLNTIEL